MEKNRDAVLPRQPVRSEHDSQPEIVTPDYKEGLMLRWAIAFFIIAIIAAIFGFSGIAIASAGIAKILFVVFLVLFLLSLIGHLFRRV